MSVEVYMGIDLHPPAQAHPTAVTETLKMAYHRRDRHHKGTIIDRRTHHKETIIKRERHHKGTITDRDTNSFRTKIYCILSKMFRNLNDQLIRINMNYFFLSSLLVHVID